MATTISNVIDYVEKRNSVLNSTVFDNMDSVLQDYWIKESIEVHREFLKIVEKSFGTLSFTKIVTMLNIWLYNRTLSDARRLFDLGVAVTVIENSERLAAKIIEGENEPHFVLTMILISKNIVTSVYN